MLAPHHQALREAATLVAQQYSEDALRAVFQAPLMILSAPRAGSNLLFETLGVSERLWSIGTESHVILNAFPELHPSRRGFESGRLTETDATPEVCHLMRACFLVMARNHAGIRYLDLPTDRRPTRIRLIEKTPRNALNLPFFLRLFPDLQVIFLYRQPQQNIASIIAAWEQGLVNGNFVTFPNLPGWDRGRWCLLLPPGWRAMNGKPLAEIATFQWCAANGVVLDDLAHIDRARWIGVSYEDLTKDPLRTVGAIMDFAGLTPDERLKSRLLHPLPLSKTTTSKPAPDKWKRYGAEIEALADRYSPVWSLLDATPAPAGSAIE